MSLREKAVFGILWSLWQQLSGKIISFSISIVLARLLEPSQFGLIAMLSVFIAIGNSLLDSGLTSSLIRTTNADQRDYSTVFYFNLAGSIAIYALLFLFAPYIAAFYRQPLLTAVLRVYGINLIINALFNVQSTLLVKGMRFKQQTNMLVPAAIGGGIVGIVLAKMGYGVWSLVWMYLCTSSLSTLMHWIYSSWRPILVFDKSYFKRHFNFGYKLTISGLIDTVYQNLNLIIVGKFFSATQLGFYSRADSISQLPISNISTAVNRVAYPMFAEISDNVSQLKNVYKRLIQQVLFWNAPVLIYLCVAAQPLFHYLLTDKWLPAVPYFKILCLSGIMYPLHAYNLNILKVMGKSALFLRIEVAKKVLSIAGLLLVIPFGIFGLLYFQLLFNFVAYYINSIYSGKLINYPIIEQIEDIMPVLILAGCVGVSCYFIDLLLIHLLMPAAGRLVITSLFFVLTYYAICQFITLPAITDFKHLILKK